MTPTVPHTHSGAFTSLRASGPDAGNGVGAPDAGRSRDTAQTSIVGTPAVSGSRTGTADFSDQEHIRDIRRCWTLAKLDALIWKRRNATPQPTEAERNAWREHRAKLMRAGK